MTSLTTHTLSFALFLSHPNTGGENVTLVASVPFSPPVCV